MISSTAVRATYAVAFGYVFMDVIDKANKTYKSEKLKSVESPMNRTAAMATDCFLWQTFASVLVPGFTINRICKLSSFLLNKTEVKAIVRANKVLTTAIGLSSIPFIIHPIDHACHVVMDKTVRPALGVEPYFKK
jgi:fission process protein 1